MRTTLSLAELPGAVERALGPSRWIEVAQDRIDAFAEVTEDRQWIHVDADRAAAGPFGATIAHGYLTLSLLSAFIEDLLLVSGGGMAVNYGLERVRFPAPVRAGSRVRATGRIAAVTPLTGGVQAVLRITVHADEGDKPVCVADMVIRYLEEAA